MNESRSCSEQRSDKGKSKTVIRKIVNINEELCNGCGNCIPNCAEGALQIIDGKAKILKEMYCDGLGVCLGHCPQEAISITEREAPEFNEEAVNEHLSKTPETPEIKNKKAEKPQLKQWPIQLNLVPLKATFYNDADLLVAADCFPAAHPKLHDSLSSGKAIVIGCPKFDDVKAYTRKLTEIFKQNNIKSITIAHMEVPCCSSLKWIINQAVQEANKQIPINCHVITVKGEMR
ncbi:MAG: 4Fe-4S ferredoxin [Candidatus Bathyarchaeota archaeon]|nr:4Fe-4S ferredoxin [Candidatus Bathyarchaeota archaeon]